MLGPYYGDNGRPYRPVATKLQILAAVRLTRERGGHTEHLPTGEQPTTGYMVSQAGAERVVVEPGFTPEWLSRYVVDHATRLRAPENYLGLWIETNPSTGQRSVYADVSVNVSTREDAQRYGRSQGQQAIYDVERSVSINL